MLELVTDTRVELSRSAARHGVGLLETIRVEDGRPRWLDLHLERLAAGCAFLGLEEPPPAVEIQLSLRGNGVLRLVAVDRTLMAWFEPLEPLGPEPLRIGLSRSTVRCPGPLTRHKTLSRLENHLLAAEARSRGLDEILAPTGSGRLSDGSRSTLVALVRGRLLTPGVEDGALPGVGRRVLLEAGLLEEGALTWGDLAGAQAIGLVSALRGLLPVGEAEGVGNFDPSHPDLREAIACLTSWKASDTGKRALGTG